jgi:hypothetical protein
MRRCRAAPRKGAVSAVNGLCGHRAQDGKVPARVRRLCAAGRYAEVFAHAGVLTAIAEGALGITPRCAGGQRPRLVSQVSMSLSWCHRGMASGGVRLVKALWSARRFISPSIRA